MTGCRTAGISTIPFLMTPLIFNRGMKYAWTCIVSILPYTITSINCSSPAGRAPLIRQHRPPTLPQISVMAPTVISARIRSARKASMSLRAGWLLLGIGRRFTIDDLAAVKGIGDFIEVLDIGRRVACKQNDIGV